MRQEYSVNVLTDWEDQRLHNTAKLLCFSAASPIMSLKGQRDTTLVISEVILVRYRNLNYEYNFCLCLITLCTRKAPWVEFMTQHGEFSRNVCFACRPTHLYRELKKMQYDNSDDFFYCTEGRSKWTIWTNHAACSNYSSARGWLTAMANITDWEGQQWISETETKAVLHPDKDEVGEVY